MVVIFGSVGMMVGTLLPWHVFPAPSYPSGISPFFQPGYIGNGYLVEIAGLIILLMVLLYTQKASRLFSITIMLLSLTSAIIALWHSVPSTVTSLEGRISNGPGYYLVLISAALGILGGYILYKTTPAESSFQLPKWTTGIILVLYVLANLSTAITYNAAYHLDSYSRVATIAKAELPTLLNNPEIINILANQADLIWIGFPIGFHWEPIQNYHCFDSICSGIYIRSNTEYYCWTLEDMGSYYQLRGPFTLC
jgi:hypothetical protein